MLCTHSHRSLNFPAFPQNAKQKPPFSHNYLAQRPEVPSARRPLKAPCHRTPCAARLTKLQLGGVRALRHLTTARGLSSHQLATQGIEFHVLAQMSGNKLSWFSQQTMFFLFYWSSSKEGWASGRQGAVCHKTSQRHTCHVELCEGVTSGRPNSGE